MIRALLVLLCVAVLLLTLAGMRIGWRHRMQRQAFLPALPPVPPDLRDGADTAPATLRSTGLYVGTSFAESWQDRVVHGGLGLRAEAEASLHAAGVLIDRSGAEPVFVPRDSIVSARLAPGLAGKVTGEGGLLVVRWRLGDAELDTGFRADDKTAYPAWVRAINEGTQHA